MNTRVTTRVNTRVTTRVNTGENARQNTTPDVPNNFFQTAMSLTGTVNLSKLRGFYLDQI